MVQNNELINKNDGVTFDRIEKIIDKDINWFLNELYKSFIGEVNKNHSTQELTELPLEGFDNIKLKIAKFYISKFILDLIISLNITTLINVFTVDPLSKEQEDVIDKLDLMTIFNYIPYYLDDKNKQNIQEFMQILRTQREEIQNKQVIEFQNRTQQQDYFKLPIRKRGRTPKYSRETLINALKVIPGVTNMSQTKTAIQLGMSEANLRKLLKKHEIDISKL